MSSLKQRIDDDIKLAMKARDSVALDALRAIKAAILLAQTEKGANEHLSQDTELKILQKLLKQRKEAAVIFKQQSRDDLADIELMQAAVIENYLPQMLDEVTIISELKIIISELNVTDIKDFGKVMGVAAKKFAGKADNAVVAKNVKLLLSGI